MFPWNEFDTVVFERGLALHKESDGRWSCQSSVDPLTVDNPQIIARRFNLRPIVAMGPCGAKRWTAVLPAAGGRLLNIYRSELSSQLPRSVSFGMGAMLYHCASLANWYANACRDFVDTTKIPGWPTDSRCVTTPEEPYFEFEALVCAVVRTYEYLTVPLWKRYGGPDSPPRNFARALQRCQSLPSTLRDRIQRSHDRYFVPAKAYRDCIHHYVDIGSCSWAMMERLDNSVWTVLVRIPDNPESKSRKKFTFQQERDALTFGWHCVTEVFTICDLLFGSGALSGQPQGSS